MPSRTHVTILFLWIWGKSHPQLVILRSPSRCARAQEMVKRTSPIAQTSRLHQVPRILGEGNVNWRQKELRSLTCRVPNLETLGAPRDLLYEAKRPLLVGNYAIHLQ